MIFKGYLRIFSYNYFAIILLGVTILENGKS